MRSKLRGLMFSKKKNLLFIFDKPRYVNLHMLFVFFSVDALFLDDHLKIIDIIHMKPFRVGYKSKYKARFILEMAEEHWFKVGDNIGCFE
jgi:uncharacterized membrane protein (UPF0127 family)